MIVIENYCKSFEHERYNSSVIRDLLTTNEKVYLFCCSSHWESIMLVFDAFDFKYSDKVIWNKLPSPWFSFKLYMFFHNIVTSAYVWFLSRNSSKRITFTTGTAGNIFSASILFKNYNVDIHLHSAVNDIIRKQRLFNYLVWIEFYFRYSSKKINYCCLSSEVCFWLSSRYPFLKFKNIGLSFWKFKVERPSKTLPIKVGYIGNATQEKGIELLKILIDIVDPDYFKIIKFGRNDGLKLQVYSDDLSSYSLNEFLKDMDVIVLPYDVDYYKFVVPATLFDCIGFGVPFIITNVSCLTDLDNLVPPVHCVIKSKEDLVRLFSTNEFETIQSWLTNKL